MVVGKNSGDINFRLPRISEKNHSYFDGSREWYFDHFENVKFLNEEPNPDWINFFHDYNVLLVKYQNPFK